MAAPSHESATGFVTLRKFHVLALVGLLLAPASAFADLRMPTSASMARQNAVARAEGYTFLRTPQDVWKKVELGDLVSVEGNGDYALANVSFPVARPEVRLFLERLGAEYREACGGPLVVTSLTRPVTRQPRNASRLSVHPAGMAIDLRVPADTECREWLEWRLLDLQAEDLLEVIRESRPPHYHVGLFPTAYREYVEEQLALEAQWLEAAERLEASALAAADSIALVALRQQRTRRLLRTAWWPLLLVVAPIGMMALRRS
jgi:hypothetical protein